MHCSIIFLSVKICSEQNRLLLKPVCCSLSFNSMESFRLFSSIILGTFPGIDNSVIPLQLLQFDKLAFLGIFTIIPFFHFSGTSCCRQQLFKSDVKDSIKHSLPFFSMSLVIFSNPGALLFFNFCTAAVTSTKIL